MIGVRMIGCKVYPIIIVLTKVNIFMNIFCLQQNGNKIQTELEYMHNVCTVFI
jgi:hypothetical protein